MATSRLSLYRGACEVLGERKVASLTEDVPTRRDLDGVWDRGGVERCLSEGLWNFATRTVQLDYDPSYTPDFGYARVFGLPDDWVRLVAISDNEFFEPTYRRYHIDARAIHCDLDTIYLRYVSKDSTYGLDFSKWPSNFTAFVEHDFAWRICRRTTGSGRTKMEIERDRSNALAKARSTDAAEEPAQVQPSGSWSRSRGRRGPYYSTRGTRLY
jgi:hypothetical protein